MFESTAEVKPLSGLATNILELLQQRDAEELSDPAWSVVALSDELLRTEEAVKAALVDELEPAGLAIEIDADHWCVPADASKDEPGVGVEVGQMQDDPAEQEQDEPLAITLTGDAAAAVVEAFKAGAFDGEPCEACDGTGLDEGGDDCAACDGTGLAPEENTDLVPAGDGAEVVVPLTVDEQAELARLESVVAEGAAAMCAAGVALCSIRDQRLYRELHETFEGYVEDRLGVSVSHAYRWMDWARVQANVAAAGLEVQRESHARELAQLPADSQAEVFRRAQESAGEGRLTANQIKEAREAFMAERVVAIVEAAGKPITAKEIVEQMDGIDDPWKLRDALSDAAKRGLLHRHGDSWPEQYAAGAKVYHDAKITIPAALVERHAKSGIHQTLDYWVRGLVEAALDEAEAGTGDGSH